MNAAKAATSSVQQQGTSLALAFFQPANDQISSTCTHRQIGFRSAVSW
jgi:hypothetical protein